MNEHEFIEIVKEISKMIENKIAELNLKVSMTVDDVSLRTNEVNITGKNVPYIINWSGCAVITIRIDNLDVKI